MNKLYHNNGELSITNGLNHQTFSYLTIRVENFDYSLWVENDLPTPTIINHIPQGYILSWALNGYFGSQSNREYFQDVTHKILALFPDSSVYENEPFKTKYSLVCEMIYHLADFSHLPDKREKVKRTFVKHSVKNMGEDELFEIARFQCYDLKIQNRLSYEACYDIFYTIHKKYNVGKLEEIKYKAKSVYLWTEKNYNPNFYTKEEAREARRKAQRKYNIKVKDLNLKKDDELMTREENAKAQAKNKIDKNYKLCKEALTTLAFLKIKINGVNLAKETSLNRVTASKYLKLLKKEEADKKEKNNDYISPFFA